MPINDLINSKCNYIYYAFMRRTLLRKFLYTYLYKIMREHVYSHRSSSSDIATVECYIEIYSNIVCIYYVYVYTTST